MNGFDMDKLKVETADGLNFVLLEAFDYTRKDGCTITVPVGSESDGASTPRAMWRVIPPFGVYWKAAFLHDYLYRATSAPKDFCDETFLEAMEWLQTPGVLSHPIYEGVHLLGWTAFNEDRKESTWTK